ncbi:FAD-dependent monooxygenase [Methylobacterium sp. C1]|uniref:FAD-dependent monooxygenase n=1 Tax=Methylobacterium sp. C1 TaxID=1479019 RepID=UPI0008DA1945|nr:FAD-dependent monooxygenase [Methylobacterium sp. C1]
MQQVLIVGAGPVGLTLASELARYGIRPRIIDRSAHQSTKSKALAIWSRTLELMDRMGCTPAFLDAGVHAHGGSFHNGSVVLGHTRFDTIASPYNFGLMIPQTDTERLLIDHLQSFGVAVEREVELTSFSQIEDRVEVHLKHADGREENLQTSWLIGCDGARSTLRTALGLEFKGTTDGDDWMLADIRLEGENQPPRDEIAAFLHPDGPFVVFPMPNDRTRIIAGFNKTESGGAKPEPILEDVQRLSDKRIGRGWHVTDPVWLANFHINERKVSEYRKGRVFLAGDAAHIHSPAGGQGMNTGMQDAINLAWKLALVVRGEVSAQLLDSYTPERSSVGEKVLRNASWITELGTLTNPAAQMARNLVMKLMFGFQSVRDREAASFSEVEIAYAQSPLSTGRHAGNRLPPEQYDGPPPGSGSVPRFVLYSDDKQKGGALTTRFPGLLEPAPRRSPTQHDLLIVRPDGYVGFAAGADKWGEAEKYLSRLAA